MPYAPNPRACTEIPCYVAYRCSKCNAVNVFTKGVRSSVEYHFEDEKESARKQANEKAENELKKYKKLENTKEPWLTDFYACKKCGCREPWATPKIWSNCAAYFTALIIGFALLILLSFFARDYLWIGGLIFAALIVVLLIVYFTHKEYDRDKLQEFDDLNLPHMASNKDGLLKILYEIDPQNEYGNLDDFEDTLYAERREYYENVGGGS